MKQRYFLYIGDRGSARITKTGSRIAANEIEIELSISIPDKLFQRPLLQASVTVPEEAVKNEFISEEVINNVSEVLKQSTGLEFNITVKSPDDLDIQ